MNGLSVVEGLQSGAEDWQGAAEYPRLMVHDVVMAYAEAGLAPEFTAILGRHISDLHVVVDSAISNSKLAVSCHIENEGEAVEEKKWHREFVLSEQQLQFYQESLQNSWHKIMNTDLPKDTSQRLALDWIFFEQTADAAANSCYMQHKYDKYITDYNGQSPHYRSELTISRDYLEKVGAEDAEPPLKAIEADHEDFRAGMALVLLYDSLLRSGAIESAGKARWIIKDLIDNYPSWRNDFIRPHSRPEIVQRLASIETRNVRSETARFVFGLSDPDED